MPLSVTDSRLAAIPFALYHGLPIRPPTDLAVTFCRLLGVDRRCVGSLLQFTVSPVSSSL